PVDEGKKRFAVAAVRVREAELKQLAAVMQRRVDRFAVVSRQVFQNKIQQTVARLKGLAVVNQLQPRVQVAVMAKALLDVLRPELNFLEDRWIGFEADESPVKLVPRLALLVVLKLALLEPRLDILARAMAADQEFLRQRVDGLRAHSVQPDAELEHFIVVFRTRVDRGNAIHHLAKRNA